MWFALNKGKKPIIGIRKSAGDESGCQCRERRTRLALKSMEGLGRDVLNGDSLWK